MKEFQDITLDEIKNLTFSKAYNIVCINYDEKNGINIFTEEDTKEYLEKNIASFLELQGVKNKIEDMYRIYIFNDDFMKTIFNFGNNIYKYNEISESDFKNSHIKYIYLKDTEDINNIQKYNKLKVRVGFILKRIIDENGEKKSIDREAIQYIGYTEEV